TTDVLPPQPVSALEGTWRARLQDGWTRTNGDRWISFQLDLTDGDNVGMGVPLSELSGLGMRDDRWTAANVQFTLNRDAGSLSFKGSFDDGVGSGTWRFNANPDYARAIQQTSRTLTSRDFLRLAVHDVNRSFIASIEAEGYKTAE